MEEGKHLVLCIDLSFVSSQHTHVSCQVEMGSLQPPLLGTITPVSRSFTISLCMNALSSTLKWRDLVAMGLHVCNMFVNREASLIEAAETAHVMPLRKANILIIMSIELEVYLSLRLPGSSGAIDSVRPMEQTNGRHPGSQLSRGGKHRLRRTKT